MRSSEAQCFAAASSRCVLFTSFLMRVLLVVPVPVPVVLLVRLVCDSTNRAENTSPIPVRPKIYVGHEPRTTVDFPYNIKGILF